MNKILKKILVTTIMLMVGCTVTGVITYINIGYSDNFIWQCLTSFFKNLLVMTPIGYVVMKAANKMVHLCFSNQTQDRQNILLGIIMATLMQAFVAVNTTLNNIGFTDIQAFLSDCFASYTVALPMSLVLSTTMTRFVKPRIDAFLAS